MPWRQEWILIAKISQTYETFLATEVNEQEKAKKVGKPVGANVSRYDIPVTQSGRQQPLKAAFKKSSLCI